MSIFEVVYKLLNFLVLLSPFFLLALRGIKVGLTSMLVWIPVAGSHMFLIYIVMAGGGHGSGTDSMSYLTILIAYGPQISALALFYVIFKRTADLALKD